jgi:hypothetical protein
MFLGAVEEKQNGISHSPGKNGNKIRASQEQLEHIYGTGHLSGFISYFALQTPATYTQLRITIPR